jgi:hypothetical protein
MPWTEPIIPADAPIARDPADTYSSHISNYGRGGLHVYATTVERDACPADRLVVGMLAAVTGTGVVYQLSSKSPLTWTPFTAGGSGTSDQFRIIGRVSSGAGAYEQLTAGDGIAFDGSSVRVDAAVTTQIDDIETTIAGYASGIDGGTW